MRRANQERLTVCPLTLAEANRFVGEEHRHHRPTVGHKFSIGVRDESGALRGVAIAGRPVARALDDGLTLEVNRVATDGCQNACSALYGAVARVATAMGYARSNVITYILDDEPGTTLVAAGWVEDDGSFGGSPWDRPGRSRADTHPIGPKRRWRAGSVVD